MLQIANKAVNVTHLIKEVYPNAIRQDKLKIESEK